MRWPQILRATKPTGGTPFVRLPPRATVHPLGSPVKVEAKDALLRFPGEGWLVNSGGKEAWAVVGDAEGRRLAVDTVLGRHRIVPTTPTPGPLPVNSLPPPPRAISPDDWKPVRYLAFARPAATGEFTDYTARYGALQEEDRLTLRQKLEAQYDTSAQAKKNIYGALNLMGLQDLVDMPAISLSSGQMRRARIAQALMTTPAVLLLEDPMAGLDHASRKLVSALLGELNGTEEQPRIVLVLRDRGEDTLNDWITHVCDVQRGNVWIGSKAEWEEKRRNDEHLQLSSVPEGRNQSLEPPVVQMTDVSVSYGEGSRQVLKKVNWVIRPGDRWHLQGANGSGKTTLLSVLLGQHPQSYSLPATNLTLFSQPRRLVPTTVIKARIGHSSPEVFAAFPRNMGLSAFSAIGTGFEGVFSYRSMNEQQKERILYLLEFFRENLATTRTGQPAPNMTLRDIANKPFAHYTAPQQALLIFLRAVVSRPPLLVLDEPTQGMDEDIWVRGRELLAKEWEDMAKAGKQQAVVVVSHYDDEVPWKHGKVLRLVDGEATTLEQES